MNFFYQIISKSPADLNEKFNKDQFRTLIKKLFFFLINLLKVSEPFQYFVFFFFNFQKPIQIVLIESIQLPDTS